MQKKKGKRGRCVLSTVVKSTRVFREASLSDCIDENS